MHQTCRYPSTSAATELPPSPLQNSVAYSQALRIHVHWIGSRHTDYLQSVEELKGLLVKRGYDEGRVQCIINKVTGRDRDSLLMQCESVNKQIVLQVVSFHPNLPNLTRVLHDHQCVINTSPCLERTLTNLPLVVYYCAPPN